MALPLLSLSRSPNLRAKASVLVRYARLQWPGLSTGERVSRYEYCFIFHEPHNTLIQRIRRFGKYEPFVEEFCRAVLPPTGLFVDVGANIGLISLPLLWHKPEARAWLFEPSPIARRFLLKGLAATWIERSNYLQDRAEVFDCALAAENREAVSFVVNEFPDRSMDGLVYTERTGHYATIQVPQRTLDDIAAERDIHRMDLIKLDCEGAELLVLHGATRCLARFKPIIVTEFDPLNYPKFGIRAADLWNWAREANYLILSQSMDVLDLCALEIRIGIFDERYFILVPEEHRWCGI